MDGCEGRIIVDFGRWILDLSTVDPTWKGHRGIPQLVIPGGPHSQGKSALPALSHPLNAFLPLPLSSTVSRSAPLRNYILARRIKRAQPVWRIHHLHHPSSGRAVATLPEEPQAHIAGHRWITHPALTPPAIYPHHRHRHGQSASRRARKAIWETVTPNVIVCPCVERVEGTTRTGTFHPILQRHNRC